MIRYLIASLITGLLFAIMDGVINGNPYAIDLMESFDPIAKQSINIPAGLAIDLIYGVIISGVFLMIMPSLPTKKGIIKGLTFGLGIWFFRVFMGVTSYWMMFNIPGETLIYLLWTGLIEMLILGIVNGLILKQERL